MNWKDYAISEKPSEGKKVWICDYRFNGKYIDKPIRHIKPTLVMITSSSNVKKDIYYSDWCFLPLKKNGEAKKAIITPYDQTGSRSYTGVAVMVFDAEKQCVTYYNKTCLGLAKKTKEELKEIICKYEEKQLNFLEKCIKLN